jgi:hypothetical protein
MSKLKRRIDRDHKQRHHCNWTRFCNHGERAFIERRHVKQYAGYIDDECQFRRLGCELGLAEADQCHFRGVERIQRV